MLINYNEFQWSYEVKLRSTDQTNLTTIKGVPNSSTCLHAIKLTQCNNEVFLNFTYVNGQSFTIKCTLSSHMYVVGSISFRPDQL